MLGTCGEYIVAATNSTDEIVEQIKEYEKALTEYIPSPFIIRKIGIKTDIECTLIINGREFIIDQNGVLEFGYDMFNVTSIVAQTEGANLKIRYLY